jgi:hypothetical protein
MKGIKEHSFYNTDQLSIMLGVNKKSVRNILSKAGLKKYKTTGTGIGLYTDEQVNMIRKNRRLNEISHYDLVDKNYKEKPIIITYYIYESKMNRDEEG